MSRRREPMIEVRESRIQGRGVFATRKIRAGTRIIEYTGERISEAEADARYDDDDMERTHTFLFTIDDDTVIDATVYGNEAKYINHACDPNCQSFDDGGRIFIEALRTIAPGEELVYDYRLHRGDEVRDEWIDRYVCNCGAANCRGTLLWIPSRQRRRRRPGRQRQVARAS